MIIHGFTISAFGHCADRRQFDSARLVRAAVGYLISLLDKHGNSFRAKIPLKGAGHIDLRWTSDHLSCGIGTFYAEGELLSTNVMVSGISAEADRKALETAQAALSKVCSAAGAEAAQELLLIDKRPALATIRWTTRSRRLMDLVGDMEICLAAAFLERAFHTGEIGL